MSYQIVLHSVQLLLLTVKLVMTIQNKDGHRTYSFTDQNGSLIQTNQPETKQNKIGNLISFLVVLESFNIFFYLFYADDTLCSFNVHIGVQSCNAVQCWELSRGDTVTVWRIYEREPWRGDSRFSDTADITYWWEDSASKSREKGDGPSRTPRTSIQSMFSLSINTALSFEMRHCAFDWASTPIPRQY